MLLFTVGKKLVLRTSNAKVFRGIFNAHYAQHLRKKEWKYPKIGNGKRVRLLEKYSGHAIFGQVFMADRHETIAAAATSENAPFSAAYLQLR